MTEQIRVPFGDDPRETATLLLAAAEETGDGPDVVRTSPFDGSFYAPREVVDKAGLGEKSTGKEPAKKTAAKKTASKKSAAKKTSNSKEQG